MRKTRAIKRFVQILLTVILIVTSITGCGKSKKKTSSAPNNQNTGMISREQFIGLLGSKFGMGECLTEEQIYSDVPKTNSFYNAIQACAEWEVIPKDEKFRPSEQITLGEALVYAVRAIGLKNIDSDPNYTAPKDSEIVSFFTDNIAEIDTSDLNVAITDSVAVSIIEYASVFRHSLIVENVFEYTLAKNAYEIKDGILLKGDGETAIVSNASQYSVGDILYVPALNDRAAAMLRIREIDGDKILYEEASIEETFESLHIAGTYDMQVADVQPADGVVATIYDQKGNGIVACGFKPNDATKSVKNALLNEFNYEIGNVDSDWEHNSSAKTELKQEKGGVSFIASISCDGEATNFKDQSIEYNGSATFKMGVYHIKTTVDYYHGFLGIPNGARVELSYDDEISLQLAGSARMKIPMGSITLYIPSTPIEIPLSLTASVGIDGFVDISYTAQVSCLVDAQPKKAIITSVKSTENVNAQAQAQLVVEPTLLADFKILGIEIANAEVTTGVVCDLKLDADILGNQPTCADIFAYVPLRWGINQKGCLLTNLCNSWKADGVVWDSVTSPFKIHYHYENWNRVDECTRGQEEKVEAKETQEDGTPLEEYTFFDFEEIDAGFIRLGSQKLYLDSGEKLRINVTEIPEGYSKNDLVYTPLESGIVSVDAEGYVTALSEGSTVIKVETRDGKYATYMNAVVKAKYTEWDEFPIL